MLRFLGAPFDFGCQFRSGARFLAAFLFVKRPRFSSFGHAGAYDHEDDATIWMPLLPDRGHWGRRYHPYQKPTKSHANIAYGVRNSRRCALP